ncbi:cold-shock protein [Mycobacteroides saopaulense]|nr:cold shock domain-containing protein [Mycobacteroides saopaulense]
MAQGIVKFFKPEKGWGAITSPELPDGLDAFAHYTAI